MRSFLLDLKLVVRQLRQSPGFTATAVLMLAFGIGATTAIFSIVEGVLLRPLPFPDSDRLMVLADRIQEADVGGNGESGVTTIAPTPTKIVEFSSKTVAMPALRPGSRRSAASHSSAEPSAAESGPSSRMPSAVSPASHVPARIHRATIGGWSK